MYSSPDSPTEELVALISDTVEKKPVKWKKPHTGLEPVSQDYKSSILPVELKGRNSGYYMLTYYH